MRDKNISAILERPGVAQLFNVINNDKLYLVGGCIRNALSNQIINDIDFATILEPKEIINILDKNNIKFLDIGLDHGTITAIIDKNKFEITTCRKDIATDGRHAKVEYTKDIEKDSARRDFSFNAIYVDSAGKIYDFHNGINDLKENKIRFIGNIDHRLQEDYLRILRFFRFQSVYHDNKIEEKDLDVIQSHIAGLNKVSKERIWAEFKHILSLKTSLAALKDMEKIGLFSVIFPGLSINKNYEKLNNILLDVQIGNSLMCKLSCLLNNNNKNIHSFIDDNPLSNLEKDTLLNLTNINESILSYMSMQEMRAHLYRLGQSNFINQILLRWCNDRNDKNNINWRTLLEISRSWIKPEFNIQASDIMNMGIPEGPRIGEIMKELEEWWINNDFIDDKFSLIERLKAICFAQH